MLYEEGKSQDAGYCDEVEQRRLHYDNIPYALDSTSNLS